MSNNSNTPSLNLQPPPEARTLRKRIGKWFGNKLTRTKKNPDMAQAYKPLPYKSVKRTPLTKKSGDRIVPDRPLHKRVWSGIRGLAGKTKNKINAKLHDPLVVKYTPTHRTSSGKSIESGSNSNSKQRLEINLPATPLDLPAPRLDFEDIANRNIPLSQYELVEKGYEPTNKFPLKIYKFKCRSTFQIIYNPNADHMVLALDKHRFFRLHTIYLWAIEYLLEKNAYTHFITAIEKAYKLLKSKRIRYNIRGRYNYFLQGERKYTSAHTNKDTKDAEYGTPNIEANVHALKQFVDAIRNAIYPATTA